jgi:hypothetical protein
MLSQAVVVEDEDLAITAFPITSKQMTFLSSLMDLVLLFQKFLVAFTVIHALQINPKKAQTDSKVKPYRLKY